MKLHLALLFATLGILIGSSSSQTIPDLVGSWNATSSVNVFICSQANSRIFLAYTYPNSLVKNGMGSATFNNSINAFTGIFFQMSGIQTTFTVGWSGSSWSTTGLPFQLITRASASMPLNQDCYMPYSADDSIVGTWSGGASGKMIKYMCEDGTGSWFDYPYLGTYPFGMFIQNDTQWFGIWSQSNNLKMAGAMAALVAPNTLVYDYALPSTVNEPGGTIIFDQRISLSVPSGMCVVKQNITTVNVCDPTGAINESQILSAKVTVLAVAICSSVGVIAGIAGTTWFHRKNRRNGVRAGMPSNNFAFSRLR